MAPGSAPGVRAQRCVPSAAAPTTNDTTRAIEIDSERRSSAARWAFRSASSADQYARGSLTVASDLR
jgi:hypothetical protein